MSAAETPSERPPAGEDPVASLFSADRTLPAPVVAPEVNESELTRWKSARESLFGESVKDPPAPAGRAATGPVSRTGRTLGGDDDEPLTEGRRSPPAKSSAAKPRDERTSDSGTPLVRTLSVDKIGHQHEAARTAPRALDASDLAPPAALPKLEPPNKKRTQLHAGAPPAAGGRGEVALEPPPAMGKRADAPGGGKRARPDTGPVGARTRKKTPPPRPNSTEVSATAPDASGRRFRRGPKPLLLAALALLVLAAGGVSAVVLEIVPDPFAEPAPTLARGARTAPPSAPVAAKPAAPDVPAAPAASKPAAAAPPVAAAAPPVAAKLPKPAAAAAVGQAPVKAAPAAAAPAKPAPAAAAPDEAADSADGRQLVALARKALAGENASGAEALARRALAKDGDDHHAMEVLARALIDQDRGPEAVTFARRIVDKRRKRVPYRLLLGDALLMVGDAAGARKEWLEAAKLAPGNREVKQRLQ